MFVTFHVTSVSDEFSMSAFSISAFSMSAFSMSAFSISAFSMSAFSISAFSMSAFSMSADRTAAFSMSALVSSWFSMSAFSMSAFSIGGFSMSALMIVVPVNPPGTGPLAPISTTSMLICACGSLDVTKTVRVAVDFGGVVTSRNVSGAGDALVYGGSGNCANEARPPGGWFRIRIRKFLVLVVMFCANTTKPRWSVALSGFALPGEPTKRPPAMRAV